MAAFPAGGLDERAVASPESVVVADAGAPAVVVHDQVVFLGLTNSRLILGSHGRQDVRYRRLHGSGPFVRPQNLLVLGDYRGGKKEEEQQ